MTKINYDIIGARLMTDLFRRGTPGTAEYEENLDGEELGWRGHKTSEQLSRESYVNGVLNSFGAGI